MVEFQTSEVDAIPSPVSLAEQCIEIGKRCWFTQEYIVVK